MRSSLLNTLFFGNYFYGICTVALSVEALLQQHLPLPGFGYFAGIFAVTILYYTLSYSIESIKIGTNPRTLWYLANRKWITVSQGLAALVFFVFVFSFLKDNASALFQTPAGWWLLVMAFPAVAIMYYGVTYQFKKYSLRSIGWMKPFVIGFVWAGLVTVYPVVYYYIENGHSPLFTWVGLFLFIKNFMFVTVLAIMFDIKDYATDSNKRLKTYVVDRGLRATIFNILIPLSVAGLGSFLIYGFYRNFSAMRILLNTIPFIMMIATAYYLHRRQSILYYLFLIDGLMLVKAICGSVAVSWF